MPNFVTVRQPAAELLRFVEKFKMAASAILNLYLAILDHPWSSFYGPEVAQKIWCRTFTFEDIVFFQILQIWLKTPIQAPKIYVLGGFNP